MEAGWRNGNVMTGKSVHPFSPSQWQELEEQAIIFNCMSLGMPIPTHLLLHLRRNRYSQPKLGFFPPYSPLGWGCFQLGSSGRAEDPEPGRCRRTDGKKWRCSRMACPDSKYCERHLHRGKNRLRKHAAASLKNENSASVLSCSPLPLFPSINTSKDAACNEPRYFHGLEQASSSGTSGLIFQNYLALDSDLRSERFVEFDKGGNQKPISLHSFFNERPEKIEEDERAQTSQCKSQRRTEELTSSGSGIPEPLPVLLDLNV
ncbi:growth-regulating factor 1-like [Phalaenopsis equestris]|uniref:growth-regulating factor 1-like n=1 Tax=Phalaenopsis equestris TaxID=78828 RepID=UPI0009E50A2F|nr:growth-regulating factor 1-like [Phalaenopsis equestris]